MKKKALNSDFFSCNLGATEHANFVWMKKQRFAYQKLSCTNESLEIPSL